MKAVAIQSFGGPEGLAVIDVPELEPGEGQVLISTDAIGVGFVDAMIRSGALADFGFKEGYIPGSEIAGIVTAIGSGVDRSLLDKRVWAFTGKGGYAERGIVPANALVPLPAGLSAVDAVTIGSCGIVAHFGLRHARFAPGESVLVRGAAGGIGIMAVQLAGRGGASAVAVTTSSTDRGNRLRTLGASHVLERSGEGGRDAPKEYDIILDIVGGPEMPSLFKRLNPGGRIVALGAVAGFPPMDFAKEMFSAFQKSLSFATFSAAIVPEAERLALVADLFAAASRGELKSVIEDILPLDHAVQAHRRLEAGGVFGRLVLAPRSS